MVSAHTDTPRARTSRATNAQMAFNRPERGLDDPETSSFDGTSREQSTEPDRRAHTVRTVRTACKLSFFVFAVRRPCEDVRGTWLSVLRWPQCATRVLLVCSDSGGCRYRNRHRAWSSRQTAGHEGCVCAAAAHLYPEPSFRVCCASELGVVRKLDTAAAARNKKHALVDAICK